MNTASKLYSFIVVRIRMLILSAAKNLKTQILRCAQDDISQRLSSGQLQRNKE